MSELFLFLMGALVSFLISRAYHQKAIAEAKLANRELVSKLDSRNSRGHFELLLVSPNWQKVTDEVGDYRWVCDTDTRCEIRKGRAGDSGFTEAWTAAFPDGQNNRYVPVNLLKGGVVIEQLAFVSCDGGRYLLPMPQPYSDAGALGYCWVEESLAERVARIVGVFYREESLSDVCSLTGVEWVRHADWPARGL